MLGLLGRGSPPRCSSLPDVWGSTVSLYSRYFGPAILRASKRYLQAIREGNATYPNIPNLDPELEQSLQEQLEEDLNAIYIGLSYVIDTEQSLFIDGLISASRDDDPGMKDLGALHGFTTFLMAILEAFPLNDLERFIEQAKSSSNHEE